MKDADYRAGNWHATPWFFAGRSISRDSTGRAEGHRQSAPSARPGFGHSSSSCSSALRNVRVSFCICPFPGSVAHRPVNLRQRIDGIDRLID